MNHPQAEAAAANPPCLLIVEDDASFAKVLRRSFERRHYRVLLASGIPDAQSLLDAESPAYAVVDLKLGNSSGLSVVRLLHERDPAMRIVVLTGFASITTAVEAIKLGACNYLVKPSNSDEIEAAFTHRPGDAEVRIASRPTSIKTQEWERIHEMLAETGFNISETARRLGMHRRTLARKLAKRQIP